jgi:hypothetical protein
MEKQRDYFMLKTLGFFKKAVTSVIVLKIQNKKNSCCYNSCFYDIFLHTDKGIREILRQARPETFGLKPISEKKPFGVFRACILKLTFSR